MGFQRMSRTDKGVHAGLSAITFKADVKSDYLKGSSSDADVKKNGKSDLMHDIDQ
jgi:tRNA U38,U39,U40 pseudouridine synthase TruA